MSISKTLAADLYYGRCSCFLADMGDDERDKRIVRDIGHIERKIDAAIKDMIGEESWSKFCQPGKPEPRAEWVIGELAKLV